MRGIGRLFVLLFVLMAASAAVFIVARATEGEESGPPVALCPGPDSYGYVCATEAVFEYVDATNDTMLYQDDDLVQLDLPFTVTFYGTDYDEILASSNGNLQFTTNNIAYENQCLTPEPAAGLGDMIAPYWDDLDLTFDGYLQTELVGDSPERIFVVEWDNVPRFGNPDDRLTFEVQIFEGSNDIVFLYRDAQTLEGPAGSEATIGIQSEQQGYALQASCNQLAVYNGNVIHFVHPEEPTAGTGLRYAGRPGQDRLEPAFSEKGRGAVIVETLNGKGKQGLHDLQATWLTQRPRLASEWISSDLDGDGGQELVVLSYGVASRPELVELAVAARDDDDRWHLRWQVWPLARQEKFRTITIMAQGDVTGNDGQEILLGDPASGNLVALMWAENDYALTPLPGKCSGPVVVRDENADGLAEVVRGGCPSRERWSIQWDGEAFFISNGR